MYSAFRPRSLNAAISALVLLAAVAGTSPVSGQPVTAQAVCNTYGPNALESVGDRDGHSIQVSEGSCVIQGGPLDGATLTQQTVWEFDKGAGNMLSSQGVYRKPGLLATYANSTGSLTFQMTDGRITGWSASGKGRVVMASGSAATMSGKTYSWTARPTGPRRYVIENIYD